MAAKQHTPNRTRARKRQAQGNRQQAPQQQAVPQARSSARLRSMLEKASISKHLQDVLNDHLRGLEIAMSAVIVSVYALRRQNADIDVDIARVLERSAADRLDTEIERVQALIGGTSHRD